MPWPQIPYCCHPGSGNQSLAFSQRLRGHGFDNRMFKSGFVEIRNRLFGELDNPSNVESI
jgi:hypothetical protein